MRFAAQLCHSGISKLSVVFDRPATMGDWTRVARAPKGKFARALVGSADARGSGPIVVDAFLKGGASDSDDVK